MDREYHYLLTTIQISTKSSDSIINNQQVDVGLIIQFYFNALEYFKQID